MTHGYQELPRINAHDGPADVFDPTAPHMDGDEGMRDYVYSPLNPEPPGAIEEGHRQRVNADINDENMYHGLVLLAFFMFFLGVAFVSHWLGLF